MKRAQYIFTGVLAFVLLVGQYGLAISDTTSSNSFNDRAVHIFVLSNTENQETINNPPEHWINSRSNAKIDTLLRSNLSLADFEIALERIQKRNKQQKDEAYYEIATLDIAISNLSSDQKQNLQRHIREIVQQGTTVIVPAGHDGRKIQKPNSEVIPAAFPETITVGTLKYTGRATSKWEFGASNYGESLDFVEKLADSSLQKEEAAIKETLTSIRYYYEIALRKHDHRPSPRLVKWEMEQQSGSTNVYMPSKRKKGDVPHTIPTPAFKGNRVPDDYFLTNYGLEGTFDLKSTGEEEKLIARIKLDRVQNDRLPRTDLIERKGKLQGTYSINYLKVTGEKSERFPELFTLAETPEGNQWLIHWDDDTQDAEFSFVVDLHGPNGTVLLGNDAPDKDAPKVVSRMVPVQK